MNKLNEKIKSTPEAQFQAYLNAPQQRSQAIPQGLTFDDVLLVPRYSEVERRASVNTSTQVLPAIKLTQPFISANMDTVTEYTMAFAMASNGCLGILHRFMSIEEMLKQIDRYNQLVAEHNSDPSNNKIDTPLVISIGVNEKDRERAQAIYKAGVRNFCIDVAHGHHILVKRTIEYLRENFGKDVGIIAGNVCSYQGAYDLFEWGADCVKVGVGPGSVCSTRVKTGAGYPQLSAIMNAYQAKLDFIEEFYTSQSKDPSTANKFIIGDGGIKNYGDVSKALAAGADTVMMGSIFAGCKQTPGQIWRNEKEEMIKTFRGMASHSAQSEFGMEDINEEGISVTVKYKGNIKHILDRLIKGLKSGMSYSAATTIPELQQFREFVQITASGLYESHPHKASH